MVVERWLESIFGLPNLRIGVIEPIFQSSRKTPVIMDQYINIVYLQFYKYFIRDTYDLKF